MFPSFLPSAVKQLRDPSAIALAQNIQQQAIATPLTPQKIATTYVCQGVCQGSSVTPILLLHGFDSSVIEFRRLLPLLATQTWAVDLLGFGFTERVIGLPFSPSAIKTHLYCFWRTLINQPVILVGASMGGATAIDFALTYSQAVQKLVLVNSVGYTGSFPMGQFLFPPFDLLAVEWWRQRKLQPLVWGTFGNWDPVVVDALQCATLHLEMPSWHEAFSTFTKSGGYLDLAAKIAGIDQPTLILWGEADDVLGSGDPHRFNQDIADSQLIWIRNCGHVPQLEQPQTLARHVLAFRNKSSR